jgi:hypothetical protein
MSIAIGFDLGIPFQLDPRSDRPAADGAEAGDGNGCHHRRERCAILGSIATAISVAPLSARTTPIAVRRRFR